MYSDCPPTIAAAIAFTVAWVSAFAAGRPDRWNNHFAAADGDFGSPGVVDELSMGFGAGKVRRRCPRGTVTQLLLLVSFHLPATSTFLSPPVPRHPACALADGNAFHHPMSRDIISRGGGGVGGQVTRSQADNTGFAGSAVGVGAHGSHSSSFNPPSLSVIKY